MSKRYKTSKRIKALAYLHRYFTVAVVILVLMPVPIDLLLYILGGIFILSAVWTVVGYKLRCKHIFCSFQNAYRVKMTPDSIRWGWVKKGDVYGTSVIEVTVGIFLIVLSIIFGASYH